MSYDLLLRFFITKRPTAMNPWGVLPIDNQFVGENQITRRYFNSIQGRFKWDANQRYRCDDCTSQSEAVPEPAPHLS